MYASIYIEILMLFQVSHGAEGSVEEHTSINAAEAATSTV